MSRRGAGGGGGRANVFILKVLAAGPCASLFPLWALVFSPVKWGCRVWGWLRGSSPHSVDLSLPQQVKMREPSWGSRHPSEKHRSDRVLSQSLPLSPFHSVLWVCMRISVSQPASLFSSSSLSPHQGLLLSAPLKEPLQALPGLLTAFRCVSGTVLQLQLRQAESTWPCGFWPRPVRLTSSSFGTPPPPLAGWPEDSSILGPLLTCWVTLITQVETTFWGAKIEPGNAAISISLSLDPKLVRYG